MELLDSAVEEAAKAFAYEGFNPITITTNFPVDMLTSEAARTLLDKWWAVIRENCDSMRVQAHNYMILGRIVPRGADVIPVL